MSNPATSAQPSLRINIIGASGSGASTFGKHLAATLGVPHFDSDDYYHGPVILHFRILALHRNDTKW